MASVAAMSDPSRAHRLRLPAPAPSHPLTSTGHNVRKGPDLGLGAGIGTSSRMPRPVHAHKALSPKPARKPTPPRSTPPAPAQHKQPAQPDWSPQPKIKDPQTRDRSGLPGRHGALALGSRASPAPAPAHAAHRVPTAPTAPTAPLAAHSAQAVASYASSSSPSRLPTLANPGPGSASRNRTDRPDHSARTVRRDLYSSPNGDSASSSQATLRPPNSTSASPTKQSSNTDPTAGDRLYPNESSPNGDRSYRSNASSSYSSPNSPYSPFIPYSPHSPLSRNDSPDLSRSQLASPFQPTQPIQPSKLGSAWRTGLDRLQHSNDFDFSLSHRPSYALSGLSDDGEDDGFSSSPPREARKRDSDYFTRVPRPSRNRSKPRDRAYRDKIDERALASPPPLERRPPTEDSHESSAASAGTSGTSGTTGTNMTNMDLSALSHSTGSTAPTTITNGTSSRPHTYLDNDEMHLALLAGQAAVDCDKLPIHSWDEVEQWKKELSHLSSRLDTLQARHQREVKILTAARTLQKLNTANKRISRHTMESLEQSERRVAAAEKEVLVLRDREAALRRRLMEHWAGVMAWEVRRLERAAMGRQEKQDMFAYESRRREEALHDHVANLEAERRMSRGLDDSVDSSEQVSEMLSRLELSQQNQQELEHQREQLQHERDILHREKEALRDERDALHGEKDTLSRQITTLQTSSQTQRADSDTQKKTVERYQKRIADLEGMVVELSRRERALEEQIGDAPNADDMQAEREQWELRRQQYEAELEQREAERQQHEAERQHFDFERSNWDAERAEWGDERAALDVKLSKHAHLISEYADARKSWDVERERHQNERSQWESERSQLHADRGVQQDNKSIFDEERAKWAAEREAMAAERENDRTIWLADQRAERQAWEEQRDKWDRERAELEQLLNKMELERDMANSDRELSVGRHDALAARHDELRSRHEALQDDNTQLRSVHDQVLGDHTQLRSVHNKLQTEHVRALDDAAAASNVSKPMAKKTTMALAAILGKLVPEDELGDAALEVRQLVEKQSKELADLRDDMDEVRRSLEEEVRRVTADRDQWRAKAEEAVKLQDTSVSSSREQQNEMTELVRKIRAQNDKIAELQQELQTAQQTQRSLSPSMLSPDQATLSQAWSILPSPRARAEAGLTDSNVVSPSSHVNFGALQHAYSQQSSDGYPGTKGLVDRIRGVVDDGRVMAERMARMEKDKERHKQNAARAAKLVEESQRSLATYQKQVKDLQERLQLATGSPVSSPIVSPVPITADLETRYALDDARAEIRALRDEASARSSEVAQLHESNQALSARTLELAEEHEAKAAAAARLHGELEGLRAKLAATEADMDNERVRQQTQNMQLLEEVNSLQAEVADLRTKLRQRGSFALPASDLANRENRERRGSWRESWKRIRGHRGAPSAASAASASASASASAHASVSASASASVDASKRWWLWGAPPPPPPPAPPAPTPPPAAPPK